MANGVYTSNFHWWVVPRTGTAATGHRYLAALTPGWRARDRVAENIEKLYALIANTSTWTPVRQRGDTPIITELDSVLLDVPDLAQAKAAYSRLFGSSAPHPQVHLGLPAWASRPGMLFGVDDLVSATRTVNRRGLTLTSHDDLATGESHGLTLGLSGRARADAPAHADIGQIDHLVLLSPNRDRIIATLCGRFGFDLRLDRVQSWGVHQLFFRCAGLVVEVALQDDDPSGPDSLWGIAWRTTNIDASHSRLSNAGVHLSDIRNGHKPGTRVTTVKDPALAVPTILIEQH